MQNTLKNWLTDFYQITSLNLMVIDSEMRIELFLGKDLSVASQIEKLVASDLIGHRRNPGDPVEINTKNPYGSIKLLDGAWLVILPKLTEFGQKTLSGRNSLSTKNRLLKRNFFENAFEEIDSALKLQINLFLKMIGMITVRDVNPSPQASGKWNDDEYGYLDREIVELIANTNVVSNHNQYRVEVAIQEAVKTGDLLVLEKAFQIPLKGETGKLGPTELRSKQNLANLVNVLCSRAAINAGVSVEAAYRLSDRLFLAVEETRNLDELAKFFFLIPKAFTLQVRNYKNQLRTTQRPSVINSGMEYIEKHLYEPLSLNDIAQSAGVSTGALQQSFRRNLGQPIGSYILSRRISVACDLLINSETSIADISDLLCFSDTSHFCRVFKKKYLMTPLHYRKVLKNRI